MMENNMRSARPHFTSGVDRLLNDAEHIINQELKRIQKQETQSIGAAKQPHVPYRDWNAAPDTGSANDQGYER